MYVRRRSYLAIAVVLSVIAGLASRKYPGLLPAAFGKYPGSVIWAQMVYWGVGFIWPTMSIPRIAAGALAISYLDEFSQLYQAEWIRAIRATTLGHLVLGTGFNWGDLLAYTIGIVMCALVDWMIMKVVVGKGRFGRQ